MLVQVISSYLDRFNMAFAYVFPGQGSQSIGMLADLATNYSEIEQTFEQGSDILQQNLWNLVVAGPDEELNRTENTQPIMLCASIAIWKIWRRKFPATPILMAGHSFGEYSALVCAQAIDFETALPLARYRGQVMQQAVPEGQGAMAAILGLEDQKLTEVCEQTAQGQIVQAVNFNAPGQTVIAGNTEAVKRAVEAAKSAGAKRAVILPLSVPSHSTLMQPAAEQLRDYLSDISIQSPQVDVIQNVDVKAYSKEKEIKDALYRQLFNPVRWQETVQLIASQGANAFVELGPGKVLTGLSKRIERKVPCYCVHDVKSLEQALEQLESLVHDVVE